MRPFIFHKKHYIGCASTRTNTWYIDWTKTLCKSYHNKSCPDLRPRQLAAPKERSKLVNDYMIDLA